VQLDGVSVGGALTVEATAGALLAIDVTATGGPTALTATAGGIGVGSINGAGQAVTLDAGGDITDADLDAGSDVVAATLSITDAANVGGPAADADLDVDIDTLQVSGVSGSAYIGAADGIDLNGVTVGGTLDVVADAGDIAATTVVATGGPTTLTAGAGGIGVGSINGAGQTVTLDAAGDITDADLDAGADVVAATLSITDAASVGGSAANADLDVDIDTLQVSGVSGSAYIGEADGVDLNGVTVGGTLDVVADAGDIAATTVVATGGPTTLTAGAGGIGVGSINGTGQTVTLDAAGDITDASLDAGADVVADTLSITDAVNVGGPAAGADLDVDIDTLQVSGVSGDTYIQEVDGVQLDGVSVGGALTVEATAGALLAVNVTATGGPTLLSAPAGTITVGTIDGTGQSVTLDAGDDIVDGDIAVDVTAATLQMRAANGIGDSDRIETDVDNLHAVNTTANDIRVSDTSSLSLVPGTFDPAYAVRNAGGGALIEAAGDIDVVGGVRTYGAQTLTASSGAGTIALAGALESFGTGAVELEGNALLQADALVRTAGSGGDDAIFNGTVDGAYALTVDANDGAGGDIFFGADIGATTPLASLQAEAGGTIEFSSSVHTTGNIELGPSGRAEPPAEATIFVANGDLTLTSDAGDFVMGRNEKLTAAGTGLPLGNLAIDVAGTAYLGDLTALGDITVNASAIRLLTRLPGRITNYLGFLDPPDQGVDYIAGGSIAFSAMPLATPGGYVSFATPTGGGVNIPGNPYPVQSYGPMRPELLLYGDMVLDLRAEGATTANVGAARAIAGGLPDVEVPEQTLLEAAKREQLMQLGIYPRDLTTDELLDFLAGRSLYEDVPEKASPQPYEYTVAVSRLPTEAASRALDTYRSIFWAQVEDEETGELKWRSEAPAITEVLQKALDNYIASIGDAEVDPLGFRAHVEADPQEAEALDYMNRLRDLFDQIRLLGLSPVEAAIARRVLLRPIDLEGMTSAELETAIWGAPVP
jgi:hypothetical protein